MDRWMYVCMDGWMYGCICIYIYIFTFVSMHGWMDVSMVNKGQIHREIGNF